MARLCDLVSDFQGPGIKLSGMKGLQWQAGYQAYEDTAKLHNVGVCDGVESADPGVEDCNQGGADHGGVQLHVYDHGQGGA